MNAKESRFSRFWFELKRRKTDRVIVIYSAISFALVQLVSMLVSALFLPGWTTTIAIIIMIIGFPVVAVFSWFFDITPGGITKTKPLKVSERIKIETEIKTWRIITLSSIIVIIVLIFFNIIRSQLESSEIRKSTKSIAVMPFENLSQEEEMTSTGAGITSMITTRLSEIKDLDVSSRAEVMQYFGNSASPFEIARKLKVFFFVTGELVKSKDKIIVNVNLITIKKDKVLWAGHYTLDKEENIDLSQLSEVPIKIANTLNLFMTPEDKRRIRKRPTQNATAYMSFLNGSTSQDDARYGQVYITLGDSIFKDLTASTSFHKAIESYDKAIKADSTFALAYAKRAITRSWGVHTGHLSLTEEKGKCWNDIAKALRLDENLTEGWVAAGFYYYYFEQDSTNALNWFRKVLNKEPDDWKAKYYIAIVLRAHNDWVRSQQFMREVARSNPKDALILTNIGISYQQLHYYDSAIIYHDKAIEIFPRWTGPYQNKIYSLLARDGNTFEARIVMDTALAKTSGIQLQKTRILLDLYDGKVDEALFKADVIDDTEFDLKGEKYLLFAKIYSSLKNKNFEKESYRLAYDFFSKMVNDDPDNGVALSFKGIGAAGLQDKANAIDCGLRAIKLLEKNSFNKSDMTVNLAQIYVLLGDHTRALNIIEELLNNPSSFSTGFLKLDPVWKPLADNSKYRELLLK